MSPSSPELQRFKLPNGQNVDLSVRVPDVSQWQTGVFSQARSCLDSLCGEIELTRLFISDGDGIRLKASEVQNLDQAMTTFESHVWPSLLSIIEDQFVEEQNDIDNLEAFLERMPRRPLHISNSIKNLYKFLYLTSLFSQFGKNDLDVEHIQTHGELKLKDSVMDSLPADKRRHTELALKIYTRVYKNSYLNTLEILEQRGLRLYLLFRYRGMPVVWAYARFREEVAHLIETFQKEMPLYYEMYAKNLIMDKFMRGEDLSPFEEKELAGIVGAIYSNAQVIHGSYPELNELDFDFESIFDGQKVAAQLIQFKNERAQKAKRVHGQSLAKTHEICQDAIASHLASRPTAQQIENAKEVIQLVKTASKTVAPKLFPGAEPSALNQVIDETEFTLPRDRESALAFIKSEILRLRDLMSHEIIKSVQSLTDEQIENYSAIIALFELLETDESESDDDAYEKVSSFCKQYLPEGLVDAAITVENRIIVSPITVKAVGKNFGVIAHEMGHRLTYEFGKARSTDTRQCLIDRHPLHKFDLESSEKREPRFLEEDFADFFAGAVLKAMGLKAKRNNFGCLFFKRVMSEDHNHDIILQFDEERHPLLPFHNDPHAAPLLRLMQIAQDLDHLTPACRAFMTSEGGRTVQLSDELSVALPSVRQCSSDF